MDKDEIRRLGQEIRDKQTELVQLVKDITAAQGNDGYDLSIRIVLVKGQVKGDMRGTGLKIDGDSVRYVPEDADGVPLEEAEDKGEAQVKPMKPQVDAQAIVKEMLTRLGMGGKE